MSKRLVGIREICESKYIPWSEQVFRKKKKQGFINAGCLFFSVLPREDNDGNIRKVWQYWTTETLIERYIVAVGAKNEGRI